MVSDSDCGVIGERIAAEYLELNGYTILERNFRSGRCEIDLIVRDGECLAFVEVKTRRSRSFGGAVDAVPPWKVSHIKRAARRYLSGSERRTGIREYRFDLVAIDVDRVESVMMLRHIRGIA